MRKLLICLLALAMHAVASKAQDDPEYRMELGASVGMAGYVGDFNGNIAKGMQPSVGIVGKWVVNPYMAWRLGVEHTKMKGSYDVNSTYYPELAEKGYRFNNTLWNADVVYEYNFLPYGTGRDYRGAKRLTPFIFAGLGLALVHDATAGNSAAMVLPLGFGVKYKASQRVNVAAEWGIHFTGSDKLDGQTDPYGISSRGLFKNKDGFSMLKITLTYSLKPKCETCNKE